MSGHRIPTSSSASSHNLNTIRKSFSADATVTVTTTISSTKASTKTAPVSSALRTSASVDDLQRNAMTLPMSIRPNKSSHDALKSSSELSAHSIPESSPRSATSSFRRLSLIGSTGFRRSAYLNESGAMSGGLGESSGGDLGTSPKLGSSLLQKLSSFVRSESRDFLHTPSNSPPSSPLAHAHIVTVGNLADQFGAGDESSFSIGEEFSSRASSSPRVRLEYALQNDQEFRHDLVDLFLAEHHAECTKKLRFIMAVQEYQRSAVKKDRSIKGRKIIEIFLVKSSMFQVLGDLPADLLEAYPFLNSSTASSNSVPSSMSTKTLDRILLTVKAEFLRQITNTASEIRKNSTIAASLLDPIFVSDSISSEAALGSTSQGFTQPQPRKLGSPSEEDDTIVDEEDRIGCGANGDDDLDVFGNDSKFIV